MPWGILLDHWLDVLYLPVWFDPRNALHCEAIERVTSIWGFSTPEQSELRNGIAYDFAIGLCIVRGIKLSKLWEKFLSII